MDDLLQISRGYFELYLGEGGSRTNYFNEGIGDSWGQA